MTIEAKEPYPVCKTPTRVVSYGAERDSGIQALTACGHDVTDALFIERCLSYESGAIAEETRVHKLHAQQCPCGGCARKDHDHERNRRSNFQQTI